MKKVNKFLMNKMLIGYNQFNLKIFRYNNSIISIMVYFKDILTKINIIQIDATKQKCKIIEIK